jgi:2-oxoglutarate ferredoxin oxidoreductase subunit delta
MPSGEEASESPTRRRKPSKVRGKVVILANRCKGCGFCVEFCPTHALEMSRDMNAKGYHYPSLVASEQCNGCDLCGMLCPDFAIFGYFEKRKKKR